MRIIRNITPLYFLNLYKSTNITFDNSQTFIVFFYIIPQEKRYNQIMHNCFLLYFCHQSYPLDPDVHV